MRLNVYYFWLEINQESVSVLEVWSIQWWLYSGVHLCCISRHVSRNIMHKGGCPSHLVSAVFLPTGLFLLSLHSCLEFQFHVHRWRLDDICWMWLSIWLSSTVVTVERECAGFIDGHVCLCSGATSYRKRKTHENITNIAASPSSPFSFSFSCLLFCCSPPPFPWFLKVQGQSIQWVSKSEGQHLLSSHDNQTNYIRLIKICKEPYRLCVISLMCFMHMEPKTVYITGI